MQKSGERESNSKKTRSSEKRKRRMKMVCMRGKRERK